MALFWKYFSVSTLIPTAQRQPSYMDCVLVSDSARDVIFKDTFKWGKLQPEFPMYKMSRFSRVYDCLVLIILVYLF